MTAVDHAAARSDDVAPAFQRQNVPLFQGQKGVAALAIEDFLQTPAFARLDEQVGVGKVA